MASLETCGKVIPSNPFAALSLVLSLCLCFLASYLTSRIAFVMTGKVIRNLIHGTREEFNILTRVFRIAEHNGYYGYFRRVGRIIVRDSVFLVNIIHSPATDIVFCLWNAVLCCRWNICRGRCIKHGWFSLCWFYSKSSTVLELFVRRDVARSRVSVLYIYSESYLLFFVDISNVVKSRINNWPFRIWIIEADKVSRTLVV